MTAHSSPDATLRLEGIRKEPILSFARSPWNGVWFNRHHIISRLSTNNPVLYATGPFYIRDAFQDLGAKRARTGLHRVSDNLHTYAPPRWLPYNYRSATLNWVLETLRIKLVQRALSRLGMKKPVLYLWDPMFARMIDHFDESLIVYHCYDEHVDFPGITESYRKQLEMQEEIILKRADIVFVASRSIYKRKHSQNANTHIVRNAANYQLFATAQQPETKVPDELLSIPRPIMGCVTRIVDQYFHVPLMRQVFAQRPDWSLVVIGPVIEPGGDNARSAEQRMELEALRRLPNVYLLGRREQHELPGYLKGMDVCLMAYPLVESILHSESPLKMYEYLAAGKPVVSSALPLISHLSEVIEFARDADEWIAAIECSLHDSQDKVERRQALARHNTWEQRAAFISTKLADELRRRRR